MFWLVLVLILAAILLAYMFLLRGRVGNPDCSAFDGWLYAHRGYHTLEGEEKRPENSRAAFRAAVKENFGVELDVHLLADGGLAVFHDSELKRMTGLDGDIEDLTTEQLSQCYLAGTQETIPTFQDALEIFGGKVPLIIELKVKNKNQAALCQTTCDALKDYKGLYCMESFDPFAIQWLKENRPDIVRGQLSCNLIPERKQNNLSWFEAWGASNLLLNPLTKPDFIAYGFKDRRNLSNVICRDVWHMKGASWTLRTHEELDEAWREGLWPIFEGFNPEL